MFKGLGNIAGLLQKAQQMGGQMQALQDQLRAQRVTGSSGGGMIEAECNGLAEVLRVTIDPTLIERGERELIEDLIPAAVNQAVAKAKQLHAEAMQSMTSDLNIPGLSDALAQVTGGGAPVPGARMDDEDDEDEEV